MVFEADAGADFVVVVLAGLDDYGTVRFQGVGGFFGGAEDGYVSAGGRVGVGEEDQLAVVGEVLGLVYVGDGTPAGFLAFG